MYQLHFRDFILIGIFVAVGLNQAFAQVDDHGHSCETGTSVDLISLTTSIPQDIPGELTQNDQDFFVIEVPSPNAQVVVSTRGGIRTFGRLFDANGILIAEDNNSGGNLQFLIQEQLSAGTYCLQVSGDSSTISGLYALTVDADVPNDEHGNSCETATNVGRTNITGEISVFGDNDYFRVQIPEPSAEMAFTTAADGELRTFGRLFDANGIFITENNNSGGGFQFLIEEQLSAGTYCLQVSADSLQTRGTYTLQTIGNFILAGSCSAEHVSISPASLNFGQVSTGSLSGSQTVTVANISSDPQHRLSMEPGALSGIDAADFGIFNDTCSGKVLVPGEQCSLKGIFAPLGEGMKTASMIIPCHDLDSLPLEVSLSGVGVPAP